MLFPSALKYGKAVLRTGVKNVAGTATALRKHFGNGRIQRRAARLRVTHINLCSGMVNIAGYCNIDVNPNADMQIDLSLYDIPFAPETLDVAICMSGINYFSRQRGQSIVNQVFRALKQGGIARFGVQDMKELARKYLADDRDFFFQLDRDGNDRFEGATIGDKFASWFYGYYSGQGSCQYFYDYESLAALFLDAGFSVVQRRGFRDSRIPGVESIDNRPEQMFYLEAVK